jgi:chromosome segregation ATPase
VAHHCVVAGDELDELYGVRPEEFTARRSELAAAAKKRGDAAAAKRISAARKPTTAAWVVNQLVHANEDVKRSLTDLGERLRAAHAAMDGAAIRELSSEQRSLVDELARAAFEGVDVTNPSATLREDVTGTLQAAVADPDVAGRLGHLAKAEQWSGFGDFGSATAVFTTARRDKSGSDTKQTSQEPPREQRRDDERASARRVEEARTALAVAERAKDDAANELSDRQTDLAVARLRRDEMRQRLEEAERNLDAADKAYSEAKQAGRDAAELVKKAKARLNQSERTR